MPVRPARRTIVIVGLAIVLLAGGAVAGRYVLAPSAPPPPNPEAPYTRTPEPGTPVAGQTAVPPVVPLAKLTVPVVYLEPADLIAPAKGNRVHSLLLRELFRQAYLIAARDGLGLSTRDAMIGEDPPDDLPAENRISLTPWLLAGKPSYVQIGRGAKPGRQYHWSEQGLPDSKLDFSDVLTVTVDAERRSREGFVTALRFVGFTGAANQAGSAAVPEDIETALADPCFVAQFAAVRRLHERIRADGESPALIGALVRGYAHLGLLTELHWEPAHKAFRARSLLYAQRLVAADAASPWGLWHRAYAAGLAGAHALALADLATAGTMAAPAGGLPTWVDRVDALCRFDTARLGLPSTDVRFAPWAAVFRYLTVESPEAVQLSVEMANAALKVAPDCARIREGLADIGGTPHRRKATGEALTTFGVMLARRLATVPGLPDGPAGLLKSNASEPAVMAALIAAGKPKEAGELTWAVPARLAEDARFAQAVTRLEFLRETAGDSLAGELKALRPHFVRNPMAGYLETYGMDLVKDDARIKQMLTSIRLRDFNPRQRPLFRALARVGDVQRDWAWQMVAMTGDQTCGDWSALMGLAGLREETLALPEKLARTSNFSPTARAAYVDDRWEAVQALAGTWEAEAQHPVLLAALGRRFSRLRQWVDAERCLKKAIERSGDAAVHEALADMYLAQGKPALWLTTLEELLKRPDASPDVARLGLLLANHLLIAGDAARALPYAEAAAEAESEPGVDIAIQCAERLGEWDRAEKWARRASERNVKRVAMWFFWCHRTGRGDVAGATALLDTWQNRPDSELGVRDYEWAAARHLLGDQFGTGAELIETTARLAMDPMAHVLAAILFDAAGRPKDCDRVLDAIPADGPAGALAALFKEALHDPAADGKLDNGKAERIARALPPVQSWLPLYAIGRFHLNRGDFAKARSYLEQVEKNGVEGYLSALAAHDLRTLAKMKEPAQKK